MNFKESFKEMMKSKKFRATVYTALVLISVLIIFQLGMFAGYKKASFSFGMGERYFKSFNGEPGGNLMRPGPFGLPDANGSVGEIVKISLPDIVVSDLDGVEKTITITDSTVIRKERGDVKKEDLVVGDKIVVLGGPNADAKIEAKLIRIVPDEPEFIGPRR